MLKGKQLILATKPFAQESKATSWWLFLSTLLLFAGAVVVTTLPLHWFVRLITSFLVALLLVRLFAMYHDYLHGAILKDSWLAKVIFTLFGYYTLNPSSIWKRSHDYHHKHNSKLFTSSIGSFPIFTTNQFKAATRFEQKTYLFIRHPLTILFGYIFAFLWGMCLLSFFRNPKKHWDSSIAILVHFGAGFSFLYFGGWQVFLFAFLIPALISGFVGAYLFYAQHNFPGARFKEKEEWSYVDAALHSTSYMKMNALMHWFTGNIGYHHVHHLNARIPFYRLPEVHKEFKELQSVTTTSLTPRDVFKCLEVKLWDPQTGRMLTRQELRSIA